MFYCARRRLRVTGFSTDEVPKAEQDMAENGRSLTALVPTRTQGLMQLNDLAEVIGSYATARNYADRLTTSRLSPYIRRRLILEEEVFAFARTVGGFARIEKFAQEVVWRTYWKGWLEARPSVWKAYLTRLRTLDETLPRSDQDHVACAIAGTTDLTYFNAWCEELTFTGYLHNHVRMWFASVWIFTLRLLWEMGARFFLDHLLATARSLHHAGAPPAVAPGRHQVRESALLRGFARVHRPEANQPTHQVRPASVPIDRLYTSRCYPPARGSVCRAFEARPPIAMRACWKPDRRPEGGPERIEHPSPMEA